MIARNTSATLAWSGQRHEGLHWLWDRLGSRFNIDTRDRLTEENLDDLCQRHPQRLVLAVADRLQHPHAQLEYLRRAWPEVPVAIAVGNWHDGARRTGWSGRDALQLPWYRWWDGWARWIDPGTPELLQAWPKLTSLEHDIAFNVPTGAVFGGCKSTVTSWRSSLLGSNALCWFTPTDYRQHTETLAPPAWILWDDSAVHAVDANVAEQRACQQLAELHKLFPDALLIVATCLPRWDIWERWQTAGAQQLLVKPALGLPLPRLLRTHFAASTELQTPTQ